MSAQAVNTDLTPGRPAGSASTWKPARRSRCIAAGDIDSLAGLLDLARELDAAAQHAVHGLYAFGYSWADIAAAWAPPARRPANGGRVG